MCVPYFPLFFVTGLMLIFPSHKAQGEEDERRRLIQSVISKAKEPVRSPLLFELDRQTQLFAEKEKLSRAEDPGQSLLPNRVYIHYAKEENKWIYVQTTQDGLFPQPLEGIRPSTILKGIFLGAKKATQKYQLNPEGIWVPTFHQEFQNYWVYSNPPKIKTVTYTELPPIEETK